MNTSPDNYRMKIYEINNILIDLQLREVTHTTSIQRPSQEAFDTLIYLIENRDRVITVDEFRHSLWRNEDMSEFEILRNIMKARQAILDDESKRLIRYDSDEKGYQLIGDVLEIEIQ